MSSPASASMQGRGVGGASWPAADAGRFEVLPRAASQQRPARVELEELEEGTEEYSESRVLGVSDSSTASDSPNDDGDDEPESSESEGPRHKRIRRV